MKKLLAMLLAAIMLLGVIGAAAEETAEETAEQDAPLVVATSTLSRHFSPFFYDTDYDREAVLRTQIEMTTIDRSGAIIFNGIEGETRSYNGTDYTYYGPGDLSVSYDKDADLTTYTYRLREGMTFSDGEPVTIDDVIFNYYVYLDPAYNGPTALNIYDIVGLQAYRTQIPEASLDAVNAVIAAVKAAGFGYEAKEDDAFTQAAYEAYYGKIDELWLDDVQGTVDYVYADYGRDYAEAVLGKTYEEVGADEGLKVALGIALWEFGDMDDDNAVLTTAAGEEFNIAEGQYPAIEDFLDAAKAKYDDFEAYLAAGESAVGTTTEAAVAALSEQIKIDMDIDAVPNIEGIRRVDDDTVEIVLHGFEASAVYKLFGIMIAPMHYYGNPGQYDYENNRFGHPFGGLSLIRTRNGKPMGAGPYRFIKYEDGVGYYEANENYWEGAPQIKNLQYKEIAEAEVPTALQTGVIDGGEMNGSKGNFETLRSFNSDGEVTGDVVTTYAVAYRGYGYIGMNADTMNVAGEPGSEASRNLRKGFATLLAVYRDTAIDSYYGDAAEVINYPISATSWAAPQAADEGYRAAFSVDVDGKDIYTAEMTREEKYDAALQAAIGFFKAAGYVFDEESGKFTEAPEGASMSYEAIIPGSGTGDHPAFAVLTDARKALDTIGIELKINDPADPNVVWETLDADTYNMWCAAWGADVDPDMYEKYHSSGIVGRGGSDSNHYHIQSDELDKLIVDARRSDDQDYRKQVYRAALDEIIDWAVEIPTYQRQNIVIVSTERVDVSTVTPDVSTHWNWLKDIQNMKMVDEGQ